MNVTSLSDRVLLNNYISGDRSAISELIERHASRVRNYIGMMVKDNDIADDIFQETFIKAVKVIDEGRYTDSGKFLSWVLRIAHNRVLDHFRREKASRQITEREAGYDMIGIGWTLDTVNFFGGLLRMMFPFSLGMLLARNFKPVKIKGIFWIAWAVLFGLFSVPAFAKCGEVSINGLYEFACILLVFPAIVWFTASGTTTGKASSAFCKFLGDISYPLYIVHYPVMYLFYAWLIKNQLYTLGETWQVVVCVYATNVLLAFAALKLYDEPVRKWLTGKLKIGVKK